MPLELGIWRIDKDLRRLETGKLDVEARLEDILDRDISIASPNWMIIGRQVPTDFGQFIDLLAIDQDGNLIVLEIKRDRTPREVIAQLLDYGSWVRNLEDADIASIFERYLEKYHPDRWKASLDESFRQRFALQEMPDSLNDSHQLVVVASSLDDSTERIVKYLFDEYQVAINAVFFRVFRDDEREFLTRVWFIDPTTAPDLPSKDETWNGEFYASFGEGPHRSWQDAVRYGFISAGYGTWYNKTLSLLEIGDRVWVNVPGRGYVGVGKVTSKVVRVDEFRVTSENGSEVPITELPVDAPEMFTEKDNNELAEYLVGVNWIKTVPLEKAVKEKGFFGNQNSVCKPTSKKWQHTVERLMKRFGIPG